MTGGTAKPVTGDTATATAEMPTVVHAMGNGMTVLVQPMPWLRTAAFTIAVRGGVIDEPGDRDPGGSREGLASLVAEMVQRGAGARNSRDLVADQDLLGLDRNVAVGTSIVSASVAMPAESFDDALPIYADIFRRPHLPADQLDDARMMGLQELRAVADEPSHRVNRRLRQMQYGEVLGRGVVGTEPGLTSITADDVRDFYTTHYHAGGAVIGVAGAVDPSRVVGLIEQSFGDWKTGPAVEYPDIGGTPGTEFIEHDSAQTHIGFSWPSIPYGHADYFRMRAGVGVLSDGMSSRLFDRVREQRGLCYSVGCGCHSLPHAGGTFGYAGTTPPRARETLDVTIREIESLADDLTDDELSRWKVRMESGLIMEQESAGSRASSLVSDQLQIGRVQTTDELSRTIESLTVDGVRDYWRQHPPRNYRVVALGPEPLTINGT